MKVLRKVAHGRVHHARETELGVGAVGRAREEFFGRDLEVLGAHHAERLVLDAVAALVGHLHEEGLHLAHQHAGAQLELELDLVLQCERKAHLQQQQCIRRRRSR